jgi:endonuclease/exonuclease/phosphatase family metal-dependent hydrolase
MEEVLSDAAWHDSQCSTLIACDFNLNPSKDAAARAFLTAGFQDAIAAPRTPTTPLRRLFEPGRQIDWAFIRGPIKAGSGQVHNRVKASDHYPISFMLTR